MGAIRDSPGSLRDLMGDFHEKMRLGHGVGVCFCPSFYIDMGTRTANQKICSGAPLPIFLGDISSPLAWKKNNPFKTESTN